MHIILLPPTVHTGSRPLIFPMIHRAYCALISCWCIVTASLACYFPPQFLSLHSPSSTSWKERKKTEEQQEQQLQHHQGGKGWAANLTTLHLWANSVLNSVPHLWWSPHIASRGATSKYDSNRGAEMFPWIEKFGLPDLPKNSSVFCYVEALGGCIILSRRCGDSY